MAGKQSLKLLFTILIFFTFILSEPLNAQPTGLLVQKDSLPGTVDYFKSYVTDFKSVVLLPLNWNDRDWTVVGFALTSGSGFILSDQPAYDFIQQGHTVFGDNVSKFVFEPFGSGVYSIPLVAAMYGYGRYTGNNRIAFAAMQGMKAIVLASAITGGIKMVFHRHRPGEEDGPYQFDGIGFSTEHLSFTSGHTALAFALAGSLSGSFSDRPWVGIVSYSMASLVGISRIYDKAHWPSDVFAGAIVGYVVGRTVALNQSEKKDAKFGIQPWFGSGASGLRLTYRF
jgi:hypothetical protein